MICYDLVILFYLTPSALRRQISTTNFQVYPFIFLICDFKLDWNDRIVSLLGVTEHIASNFSLYPRNELLEEEKRSYEDIISAETRSYEEET